MAVAGRQGELAEPLYDGISYEVDDDEIIAMADLPPAPREPGDKDNNKDEDSEYGDDDNDDGYSVDETKDSKEEDQATGPLLGGGWGMWPSSGRGCADQGGRTRAARRDTKIMPSCSTEVRRDA